MPITFWDVVYWAVIVTALSPIWGAVLLFTWFSEIRPRLIPRAEIERLAKELRAKYGDDAENYAAHKDRDEDFGLNETEHGKWRRVRKELRRLERRTHPGRSNAVARRT